MAHKSFCFWKFYLRKRESGLNSLPCIVVNWKYGLDLAVLPTVNKKTNWNNVLPFRQRNVLGSRWLGVPCVDKERTMPSQLADPLRKEEVSMDVASAYVCLVRTQVFFLMCHTVVDLLNALSPWRLLMNLWSFLHCIRHREAMWLNHCIAGIGA